MGLLKWLYTLLHGRRIQANILDFCKHWSALPLMYEWCLSTNRQNSLSEWTNWPNVQRGSETGRNRTVFVETMKPLRTALTSKATSFRAYREQTTVYLKTQTIQEINLFMQSHAWSTPQQKDNDLSETNRHKSTEYFLCQQPIYNGATMWLYLLSCRLSYLSLRCQSNSALLCLNEHKCTSWSV